MENMKKIYEYETKELKSQIGLMECEILRLNENNSFEEEVK